MLFFFIFFQRPVWFSADPLSVKSTQIIAVQPTATSDPIPEKDVSSSSLQSISTTTTTIQMSEAKEIETGEQIIEAEIIEPEVVTMQTIPEEVEPEKLESGTIVSVPENIKEEEGKKREKICNINF